MKLIKLSQGMFAQVDDNNFEELNKFNWHLYKKRGKMYAYSNVINSIGKQSTIQMHRYILGINDSKICCDHIDGDGLNNTICNLRPCNHSQNAANRKTFGVSKYKGVSLIKTKYHSYWYAKASKGNVILREIMPSEKEAALKYNEFAKKLHGEFAKLNDI